MQKNFLIYHRHFRAAAKVDAKDNTPEYSQLRLRKPSTTFHRCHIVAEDSRNQFLSSMHPLHGCTVPLSVHAVGHLNMLMPLVADDAIPISKVLYHCVVSV